MAMRERSEGRITVGAVSRDIFRAIHEEKWLSVEYLNQRGETNRYWIGICGIDPARRMLTVRGMHLGKLTVADLVISLDKIQASSVVEGSYFKTAPALLEDIEVHDEKYRDIFGAVPNLKVLDYLDDCNKLNATPYSKEFSLVNRIDADGLSRGALHLDDGQFRQIVDIFQGDSRARKKARGGFEAKLGQLALNMLSIRSPRGLYVFAYRKLRLDVEARQLVMDGHTVLCREFMVGNGQAMEKRSIRRYLDESDLWMLEDFEAHAEALKDRIARSTPTGSLVDDEPYLVVIGRTQVVDLQREYDAICEMYADGTPTAPLKAFFGELTRRPVRRKNYPLVLLDDQVDLDQLLAINKAIKYPLAYIQGPPGTGKTTTIVHTIVNAFFNGRTVLFASFNNHPVEGVFESLRNLKYGKRAIPFPIIRIGNASEVMPETLEELKRCYREVEDVPVYESTLDRNKDVEAEKSRLLTELLLEHEEALDLRERRECIEKMLESNHNLNFNVELETQQLAQVDRRLAELPAPEEVFEQARALAMHDVESLSKYLYYTSIRYLQRLGQKSNEDLLGIIMSDDPIKNRVDRFNRYLSDTANLKKLLRVFPIVATTCISARRLGQPQPTFDMTIIDEASQCDTATALIPIVRGLNLTLVGEPQQLNPVVVLDPVDNRALRASYQVPDEYDYLENSAYKTFLACDSVSDEILLRNHYRCDERIIGFNNEKYYNGRLNVRSGRHLPEALTYLNVEMDTSATKNTAPAEAEAVVGYARAHPDTSIGVITPFVNQRDYIVSALKEQGIGNVACGTVHAFQGDEQDVVLFSLSLTDKTSPRTYEWLTGNHELINVATSRAKDKLVVLSNDDELERLHKTAKSTDDLYELVEYVKSNGQTEVTSRGAASRALGIKPYSSKTEAAFLENLNHALDNIFMAGSRHRVKREVPISHVFEKGFAEAYLFYSGSFDFVVYEVRSNREEVPVLAIELDGKEHREDVVVQARDRQKNEICRRHRFELIRVENSYARRYNYIKDILIEYFKAE